MPKLLFFDTETTGNEEKDCLCQVAYKLGDDTKQGLFKPAIPIPPAASAVHHITNKMVENMPEFKYSPLFDELHKLAHTPDIIFVAHNAPFDLRMLKKEGIIPERFICTLRVARTLDPEDKIESYRLQYLRYLLELEVTAHAHDALGDVLVLEKLFERLVKKVAVNHNEDEEKAILEMEEISKNPVLVRKFGFGKYKGAPVSEIAKNDPGYLAWLLAEKEKNPTDEEDWIFTLRKYLGK